MSSTDLKLYDEDPIPIPIQKFVLVLVRGLYGDLHGLITEYLMKLRYARSETLAKRLGLENKQVLDILSSMRDVIASEEKIKDKTEDIKRFRHGPKKEFYYYINYETIREIYCYKKKKIFESLEEQKAQTSYECEKCKKQYTEYDIMFGNTRCRTCLDAEIIVVDREHHESQNFRLRQDFKTIARAYDECADIVIEAEDLPNVQKKKLIDLHPFDNKEALRTSKVSNFAPHKDNIREIHVDIGRKSSQENLTSISDSYVISYFLGCLYSNESETELVECGFRGSSLNHLHEFDGFQICYETTDDFTRATARVAGRVTEMPQVDRRSEDIMTDEEYVDYYHLRCAIIRNHICALFRSSSHLKNKKKIK
ncbi:uncharacterized protein LOC135121518 [Zophobas morio]|uniref:uncharacterized protein LOC135121518 n=1 Tax=Zophobas morio TaxID=2755281 RepID=UPI003082E6D1